MSESTVRAAVRGFGSSFGIQMVSSLFSVGVRVALARAMGPRLFAFSEVQMSLALALVMLPARESFRRIAIRERDERQSVLLATSGCFLSVIMALAVACYNVSSATGDERLAMLVTCLAAALESLSEPALVSATRQEMYSTVSMVRASGSIASSAATAVVVRIVPKSRVISAVAACSVINAAVLTGGLVAACGGASRAFAVGKPSSSTITLAGQSVLNSVVKFVLGNGENFVLLACVDQGNQGAYKLAMNLSSLVARFLFAPLEEQSFAAFARLQEDPPSARLVLVLATKVASSVALILATIGPPFSKLFVRLVYGEVWSNSAASVILSVSFLYLVFLAANGTSEGFMQSVADAPSVRSYTSYTVKVMGLYMGAAFVLTAAYGPCGLLVANMFNMTLRAAYCFRFIAAWLGKSQSAAQQVSPWRLYRQCLPTTGCLLSMIALSALCMGSAEALGMNESLSTLDLRRSSVHVAAGAVSLALALVSFRVFDSGFVSDLKRFGHKEKGA